MNFRDYVTRAFLWRVKPALRRYGRAWRYAIGKATPDDGMAMLYDAEALCGHYALASISAESVLERALDAYEDHPEIERLCEDAAARVGSKWDDNGETTSIAIDWAMDLVKDYAAAEGLTLVEVDENAAPR